MQPFLVIVSIIDIGVAELARSGYAGYYTPVRAEQQTGLPTTFSASVPPVERL